MIDQDHTAHGLARMRQRGYRDRDLDILCKYGEETSRGEIFLSERAAREHMEYLRQEMVAIERLRGSYAVLAEGKTVTVYRPSRAKERRIMQHVGR